MHEYNDILFEKLGHVARISHNRPRQRNAENTNLLSELDAALVECAADESVRVVILAATGDHFSAGHDLKEGQGRSHYSVGIRGQKLSRLLLEHMGLPKADYRASPGRVRRWGVHGREYV
jgi:enoyl-CoA hydratase